MLESNDVNATAVGFNVTFDGPLTDASQLSIELKATGDWFKFWFSKQHLLRPTSLPRDALAKTKIRLFHKAFKMKLELHQEAWEIDGTNEPLPASHKAKLDEMVDWQHSLLKTHILKLHGKKQNVFKLVKKAEKVECVGDCPTGTRARSTCKHQMCKSCCAKFNDGEACSAHTKSAPSKSRASRKKRQQQKSPEPEASSEGEGIVLESQLEEASDDEQFQLPCGA